MTNSSPPPTGHGVLLSGRLLQAPDERLQKPIADGVPEPVVDPLEADDVQHNQTEVHVPSRYSGQSLLHPVGGKRIYSTLSWSQTD